MKYKFISEDCDGMHGVWELVHDKVFTQEEFQSICEEAIVAAIEKQATDKKYASASSFDEEFLIEKLKEKGFSFNTEQEVVYMYDMGAFECEKSYRNPKLIAWGNKDMMEDYPEYFKEERKKGI